MTPQLKKQQPRVRPRKIEGRQPLAVEDLIRKRPLAKRLGVSPWTVDRWRRIGTFPRPIELSRAVLAWRISEIEKWIADRAGGNHHGH